jgi:hypothetical protein
VVQFVDALKDVLLLFEEDDDCGVEEIGQTYVKH